MTTEAKTFYKELRNVVQPMAIQNLISSAVNSADVIMLGFIGQTAIAASALAGNIAFILFMISTGLSSGLVMLGAQYWGKKDTESIKTLLGIHSYFIQAKFIGNQSLRTNYDELYIRSGFLLIRLLISLSLRNYPIVSLR